MGTIIDFDGKPVNVYTKDEVIDILTEIKTKYSEYASVFMQWNDTMSKKKIAYEALKASKDKMIDLLQQQINSLKENTDGSN